MLFPSAHLLTLLTVSAQALAEYGTNLNYRSPSPRHPRLGIDLAKVEGRALQRRQEAPEHPSSLNFTHGVASGDPYPESVVLWTRVAPFMEADDSEVTVTGAEQLYNHEREKYIEDSSQPICVDYQVFEDEEGSTVAQSGKAYTTSDIDYTVKVEVTGLEPFTTYYYQFNVCDTDVMSPMGRTKTSPDSEDETESISFAVFSCANYSNGYYNAYGNVVQKDNVDYVLHLGDYIYEYENGVPGERERAHSPGHEIFTLYDYRTRLNQYRTDLDLLESHQWFAWIPIWDDHEIANNAYRDGFDNLNNTEESFRNDGPQVSVDQRKMNAVRAYFEWMPIRQVDMDDGLRIWRSFQMGDLLDLLMLDTRHYDRSITGLGWNDEYIKLINDDTGRTLMGSRQESWFYRKLSESADRGATWRVVGDQLRFARLGETLDDGGVKYSEDDWASYRANQNRTYQHLYDNEIGNNIFLAGDTHKNWVTDLAWIGTKDYDPNTGEGAVGAEFAGTAVASTGFEANTISAAEKEATKWSDNDELLWVEGYYRGYYELHISHEKAEARFYGCPTIADRNSWDIPLANFTIMAGDNHITRPEGGWLVESGYVRGGELAHSNLTLDVDTNEWQVIGFDQMYLG